MGKPALARKISEIGKNDDDDDDDKRGEKNKMGFGGAKKRIVNGYQPEHSRPWMAVLEVTKDGGGPSAFCSFLRKYSLTHDPRTMWGQRGDPEVRADSCPLLLFRQQGLRRSLQVGVRDKIREVFSS